VSDLVLRPLEADELDLFNRYPSPPTSGVGTRSRSFDEFVAGGDYRPEWTWVALRAGQVVARAAFWAPPGFPHPFSLAWFDPGVGPDRVEVGAALLRAAERTLAEVAEMPGGRDWWRLAYDSDGDLVGLVMPTRNPSSATIGYLGSCPSTAGTATSTTWSPRRSIASPRPARSRSATAPTPTTPRWRRRSPAAATRSPAGA
jgi:hypothetical protein